MTMAVALGVGVVTGGLLVVLLAWGLRGFLRRWTLRNFASAFVGEIAAILRTIEMDEVVETLERAATSPGEDKPLPRFALPRFTVYEADAARLDQLPSPLPREIIFFYTRLATLQKDLVALDAEPLTGQNRMERIRRMLAEFKDTLDLADDILRDLRPLLSTRYRRVRFRSRGASLRRMS